MSVGFDPKSRQFFSTTEIPSGGSTVRHMVFDPKTKAIWFGTAVVGHLPLVFARGPGAGARNSIGIMLVSGMIIGTFFTLFVVPSIYTLVARTHRRVETAAAREPEPGNSRHPVTVG